jgi:hypothetical protein
MPHGSSHRAGEPGNRLVSIALAATRWMLPITIAVAGVIGIVIGRGHTAAAGAGVVLLGAGLIVWMINWLFRMSLESNRDREREEEAREYFDAHGRWPDE